MIGAAIKQYRQQLGVTQELLGKKAHVSKERVMAWEKDLLDPSIKELMLITNVLHTTTDELLRYAQVCNTINARARSRDGSREYSREEMPYDDYDDGGGFDDDLSLMGKRPSFAERISDAGFRELLGFSEQMVMGEFTNDDWSA